MTYSCINAFRYCEFFAFCCVLINFFGNIPDYAFNYPNVDARVFNYSDWFSIGMSYFPDYISPDYFFINSCSFVYGCWNYIKEKLNSSFPSPVLNNMSLVVMYVQ